MKHSNLSTYTTFTAKPLSIDLMRAGLAPCVQNGIEFFIKFRDFPMA